MGCAVAAAAASSAVAVVVAAAAAAALVASGDCLQMPTRSLLHRRPC